MSVTQLLPQLIVPINLAIALTVAACLFFVFRRRKTAFLLVFVAGSWVFIWSLPATSMYFGGLLEQRYPYLEAVQAPTAQAIIVLGGHTGGNRHNWFEPLDNQRATSRVDRAAELYRAQRAPLIIVSGAAHDGGNSETRCMSLRCPHHGYSVTAI